MTSAKVSIVIPAYNQASYLPRAIQSVIDQTFTDWELVIVDDGSTDHTAEVTRGLDYPGIRYISQPNKGLPGARNAGIAATTGEYLAFLDADDFYRPDKLAAQVSHLDRHSEIGLSYGSRIEINDSGDPICLLRAPESVSLQELVLGFPFTINDLLIRRKWVNQIGGFDERYRLHGEDRDFYLRLALAGCRFDSVSHFVAYRRVHRRRVFDRILERIGIMIRTLETAFNHPNCPKQVYDQRNEAYSKIYLYWALQEFFQNEVDAARDHLLRAVSLYPDLLVNGGASFLRQLVWFSVRDGGEHEEMLTRVFPHLPEDMFQSPRSFDRKRDWVLARGYLIRGFRDVLWGRLSSGRACFSRAVGLGGRFDQALLIDLADQLSSYEDVYGPVKMQEAFRELESLLKQVASVSEVHRLNSSLSLNRAFQGYHQRRYSWVIANIIRTIWFNPEYLFNRGLISIFARSLLGLIYRNNPPVFE